MRHDSGALTRVETKTHPKVVCYARVSTKRQRYGLKAQENAVRDHVGRRPGWSLVGSYHDIAASGSMDDRPGLTQLLRDIREGRAETVVSHRLDRLGRTRSAIWRCLWQLEDAGAEVLTCEGPVSGDSLSVLLAVAEKAEAVERDFHGIRDRTQNGRQLAAEAGGWPGGPAPYGYRVVKYDKGLTGLEIEPREADGVRTIAELIADRDLGLEEAVDELNARGVPTRSGTPWSRANLARRMQGAAFTGESVFRRIDRQWNGNGNRTRLNEQGEPEHGRTVSIAVPPILGPERIAHVQEALATHRRPRRNAKSDYPLSGFVHAWCGEPYSGFLRGKNWQRTYVCRGGHGKPSCGCVFLDAETLETAVRAAVNRHMAMAPVTSEQLRTFVELDVPPPPTAHRARIERLDSLIGQCEMAVALLESELGQASEVSQLGSGQLRHNLGVLRDIRREAGEWEQELQRRRTEAETRCSRWQRLTGPAPDITDLSSGDQRKLLRAMGVRVSVIDGTFRHREGRQCPTKAWHQETGSLVPNDPTDAQWKGIEVLLRRCYGAHHFRSALDLRQALCGILHRLRHGIKWRDLPEKYGAPGKLQPRQRLWFKDGIWQEIVSILNRDAPGTVLRRESKLPPYRIDIIGLGSRPQMAGGTQDDRAAA
jgi:DNA invertase Pin-like site-specific DNA recombinase/transposase